MGDRTQTERAEAEDAFIRTRTDRELEVLSIAFPIVANDASNPLYAFNRKVREEAIRRSAKTHGR